MATASEIKKVYELYLGRTPSAEEVKAWQDTGADFARISQDIRNSPEAQAFSVDPKNFDKLIDSIYQEQLGRSADEEGKTFWKQALQNGLPPTELATQLNQSLEGQNFDTQFITSLYRQNLARNPEQAGFQYWLSEAQAAGYTPGEIQDILVRAAIPEQNVRQIDPGTVFTNMTLADLEADPYGGRYITNSIYDLLPDAVNVSQIGNRQAQFVSPAGQQPYITNYQPGSVGYEWSQQVGLDVLNTPAVQAAVNRALSSGAMTNDEYRTMVSDLQNAKNVNDMYAAFNKPQAQVVIDAVFGQQTGEANTLAEAQAEARQRQAVLDANNLGYYQANPQLAAQYEAAGLTYPFGQEAYTGYDTRTTTANLINNNNFTQRINELLRQFGGVNDVQTPLTGQYYSETGLQPGFTPVGTPGTMFRSGVAGYVPQAELPTGFQFGAPPVNATFQQYRPGAFQPEGVTTGGFITGYTDAGLPIYSTYSNPNVNVGGVTSQLNPYSSQEQFNQLMANYQAQQAAANQG